jgi:integrase
LPRRPDSVGCTFTRIKKKTGVRYSLYALRHFYATHKLQEGTDPITLANLLGHADTAMLARVYANVAQDAEYMRTQATRKTPITPPAPPSAAE